MVEAIGVAILSAVGTSAATAGAVVGVSATVAATVTGTLVLGAGSLLLQSITTPDTKQKVSAQQFSSKQSLPPRRRAYGTVMLAGPKIEYRSTGGKFYNGIYHCEGPIGGFLGFFLEDKRANIAPGGLNGVAGIAPWQNAVFLEGHLGYLDQAASPMLLQLQQWDANDRLRGCAYSVMVATAPTEKSFPKVYPSGTWPEHRVLIRGSLVRNIDDAGQTDDPATWQWSDLATLCIVDHLTHPVWGLKVPMDLIDKSSFVAALYVDAQQVANKDGALFPRYYLGGAFDLTDEPADVLQGMLDARDGRLFLTADGKIGLSGGVFDPPEVTLTDPQIISTGQLEIGSGKRAAFNRLKISFVSPFHDYQVIEGDPWEDLNGQALADEILEADFARSWVQNHNQLRRLAKIHTARKNPAYRLTGFVTDRSGLPALYEDTIRLVLTRYGIDAVFTVERSVAAGDGSICTFDLVSIDPAAFAFDAATEEGIAPAIPGVDAAPALPPAPLNLSVIIDRRDVSGGTNAVFLRLIASQPAREDLRLIGRYRRLGDSVWIDMDADSDNRGSVISSVLADGQTYEAQGAVATYGRAAQSDWIAASGSPVTAVSDNSPPSDPQQFSASAPGGGGVTLRWINGASRNYRSTLIYRASGINAPFYTASPAARNYGDPSEVMTGGFGGQAAGDYSYFIQGENASGVGGNIVGPANVTVT